METTATAGIGGKGVADAMVCSNRDKIGLSLTFPPGEPEIHVSESQLCQSAGVNSVAALQMTGLEFNGGTNDGDVTAAITAHGEFRGKKYAMPTLSRVVHLQPVPGKKGASQANASLHTYPPGFSNHTSVHKFEPIESENVATFVNPDEQTEADRVRAVKMATVWKGVHGKTAQELIAGCTMASQGDTVRYAIPVNTTDPQETPGVPMLVSMHHDTADGRAKIAKMFPNSNTKDTVDLPVNVKNDDGSSTVSKTLPHYIVSESDCLAAAGQMASNLAPRPGTGGIKFRANPAHNRKGTLTEPLHAFVTIHRKPLADGGHMTTAKAQTFLDEAGVKVPLGAVSAGGAADLSASAQKIFAHPAKDGANAAAAAKLVDAGDGEVDE